MSEISKVTKPTPNERQKAVTNFIGAILKNEEAHQHLKDWGLQISNETVKFKGRQLDSQELIFGPDKSGKNKIIKVNDGDWNRLIKDERLLPITPVNLDKWALFTPNKYTRLAEEFFRVCIMYINIIFSM